MTIDSLAFRQSARNEAISSLLAKCTITSGDEWIGTTRRTLMDKRGEGVSVILERGERHAGKRPMYQLFDDSELRLTIFSASRDPRRRDDAASDVEGDRDLGPFDDAEADDDEELSA